MFIPSVKETLGDVIDPNPPEFVTAPVPPPTPLDRPHPKGGDIHEMTPAEKPQVVRSLAEAFEGDPHFSYVLRDDSKRLQRLGHGIASFIEHDWQPSGVIHTNDQLSGAAIWTRPGEWQSGLSAQTRILKSLVGVTSPAEIARFLNMLTFTEDKHEEIEESIIGPHYHLAMLGITSKWQSRGWGDGLLRPMLEHCDEEGATAYLESSTERSVPLYERNGFEVIAKGRYRGGVEPIHFMYRKPRT